MRSLTVRYLTAPGIAVMALMIGGAWHYSAAQPGGTYRESCKDIGVRGSTLQAHCSDTKNKWHEPRLVNYQRCRGDIRNVNGRLTCNEQGGGYGHDHGGLGAPRDPYRESCRNIHYDGNTLKATCKKV